MPFQCTFMLAKERHMALSKRAISSLRPTLLYIQVKKKLCSENYRVFGIRRRPTLPGRYQPSTIGTEGLNFCVRYGNRCDPFVITTGNGEHIQAGSLRRPFLPLRLPACPALSQGTCLHGLNVSHADNCTASRFSTVCFVFSCDRCYPKSVDFGQL